MVMIRVVFENGRIGEESCGNSQWGFTDKDKKNKVVREIWRLYFGISVLKYEMWVIFGQYCILDKGLVRRCLEEVYGVWKNDYRNIVYYGEKSREIIKWFINKKLIK